MYGTIQPMLLNIDLSYIYVVSGDEFDVVVNRVMENEFVAFGTAVNCDRDNPERWRRILRPLEAK